MNVPFSQSALYPIATPDGLLDKIDLDRQGSGGECWGETGQLSSIYGTREAYETLSYKGLISRTEEHRPWIRIKISRVSYMSSGGCADSYTSLSGASCRKIAHSVFQCRRRDFIPLIERPLCAHAAREEESATSAELA